MINIFRSIPVFNHYDLLKISFCTFGRDNIIEIVDLPKEQITFGWIQLQISPLQFFQHFPGVSQMLFKCMFYSDDDIQINKAFNINSIRHSNVVSALHNLNGIILNCHSFCSIVNVVFSKSLAVFGHSCSLDTKSKTICVPIKCLEYH